MSARIHEIIKRHAATAGAAPALIAPGQVPLSYQSLWEGITQRAATLREIGVVRADRVAIVLPDGPAMALSFLSVSAIATAAPLNPSSRQNEFESYFDDLQVKWLVTGGPFDSAAIRAAEARRIPIVTIDLDAPSGLFQFAGRALAGSLNEPTATGSDTALILTTSGTTSRPKIVALSHANLWASATNIAASLELVPADRCLDVMPLFHVHGLIGGLLSSLTAGASAICPPGFDATRFFGWMDDLRPTWYTAVPTMHQAILARASAHRDVIARRPLRFIRSSSAAMPGPVQSALEEQLQAPVIEAYGMTEASHQIARNPLPPGRRKPGSVGLPFGARVAILDTESRPVPAGQAGQIAICGTSVITAYERGGTANDESFTDGWLKTGDSGYVDEDGYVFITGRLKEIINRGGEKVNPREVDEVLLGHPAVAQAATFGMAHGTLGQEVAAALVLRPGMSCTEREIRESVAGKLAHFKVPARILFLDQIPKGPTGKVQRNLLAEQLGVRAEAETPASARPAFVPPQGPLEESLAGLWSDVLKVDGVGRDDNFFQLGGDSILGARLLARVDSDLGGGLSFVSLFEQPRLAAMAGTIAGAARDVAVDAVVSEASGDPSADAPLSFGQQRLWFLDQWQPDSTIFNSSLRFRLKGTLHVEALQQSLAQIVRRHDVLRTSFPATDGRPVQRVTPGLLVPLVITDLSSLSSADRFAEARRQMVDEIERRYDLAAGPLFRTALWKLSDDDHVLLIAVHHIVFDGWSRSVLLQELGEFYRQIVDGKAAALAPLPVQYADYARRETASAQAIDRHLAFWTRNLARLPVTELPADGKRSDEIDSRGREQARLLPPALTGAINAFCHREGATPFMTLFAAFTLLLSRLTSSTDIVVGSPIAGRSSASIEGLIGFFVKTLILRVDLSGRPSFRDLVGRARMVTLNALDHQDFPLQRLAEAVHAARYVNRNPLFDVMINFRNIPEPRLSMGGVEAEALEMTDAPAEVALTLEISQHDDGFGIAVSYQRQLFSDQRISTLLDQFENLVQQAVAAPAAGIETYSLLAPASRPLLPDPSQPLEQPAYDTVPALFAEQVRANRDAVAVTQSGQEWTYGELSDRVSGLSRTLHQLGHQPGDVIAITGPPGFAVVASMLAVLQSGGVMLTIDPALPLVRQQVMLRESRAARLLRVVDHHKEWSGDADSIECPVLEVSADGAAPLDTDLSPARAGTASAGPAGPLDTRGPAYIFFTSGSTGLPKAVLGTHQALAHFLVWQRERFGVSAGDRVSQLVSLSFDVVLRDIFLPLVSGATLSVPPSRELSGADLFEWFESERITLTHVVPSVAGWWLRDLQRPAELRALRFAFFSGEPLTDALIHQWQDLCGAQVTIVNLYGATEATMAQCAYVVPVEYGPGPQPVGWPLPHTQALVLSPEGRLCGVGERGEVVMRSPFLTLGYLNDPVATHAKFVRNPFRDDERDLLYRTGDEGRYRPDGSLELLGRVDDQVKVLGVRIELQEIELQLSHHPAVDAVRVVARKDARGDVSIEAHLVAPAGQAINQSGLRAFLRRRLPPSMIPSAFISWDALPLLPNGKVDREALLRSANERADGTPSPAGGTAETFAEVGAAERHTLLVEWNQTQQDFPAPFCLHEQVEAQCERTPQATAVISGDEEVTYATLNARANRVASALRQRGVGPNVVVGVCLDRSIHLPVALLGVLKAGGAFLPLDPRYPAARMRSMLEDSAVRVVVTEPAAIDHVKDALTDFVCLNVTDLQRESASDVNLPAIANGDSLAYVIFTSGSTGRAKGVMIRHRAVCNHNHWFASALRLTAHDRVLQQSPAIFDPSVWEIFASLAVGATVVMGSPSGQFDPADCIETMIRHRVTIAQFVPAVLRVLLDEPRVSQCGSVRLVASGGAPLTADLRDRFFNQFPNATELVNCYGPTETTIYATLWTCHRDDRAATVPIGRPAANSYLYVLGPQFELLPVGAAGELYIGGAGVASGYINRPELTAERFIPDPIAGDSDLRVYRTGDYVRYLPDGNLEFIGRLDDQVKIHGVRVELGEVEAAFAAHPLIRHVAVTAPPDHSGERHLVAYYVARDPVPSPGELRQFLHQTLPDSMVPSSFVRLNALPLTPSGKIDRQSLPAWIPNRVTSAEPFVAPRTSLEAAVAQIWSDVLHVAPISVHDDFFAIGGHSLLATQVISRLNRELGRSVPVRQIFETTTIETLARAIEQRAAEQTASGPTRIRRAPRHAAPVGTGRGPA